jgi:pimeloyl-ACP methyl ester carboxylesterase
VEELNVPLADGSLRAVRWGTGDTTVIAIHGITANALAWTTVAGALGDQLTLVAPDLRGRAGSAELPGPYGLRRHARDVVELIDFLGLERCVLVGHSMGAFVAVLTAIEYPDRVAELVLVDGGVSLAIPGTDGVPPDSDGIDAILDAVLGPAMKRLTMTFETPDAYLDFWRDHPAFSDVWSADLERYLLRDLTGRAPEYRSTCNLDAIRSDGADTLVDPDIAAGVRRVGCPATLLWAQRGMFGETPGLYTSQRLADCGVLDGAINVHPVIDANHYSILLSATAAAIVADAVQTAAAAARPV